MLVRVIKPFFDKYTHVVYIRNREIDVTAERYAEINAAHRGPYVEALEGAEKESDAEQGAKGQGAEAQGAEAQGAAKATARAGRKKTVVAEKVEAAYKEALEEATGATAAR